MIVLGGILVASEGEITTVLPAMRALFYPLQLEPVFVLRRNSTSQIGIVTSLAAELMIIGICCRAAVRRYRASDLIGISSLAGVLLVLTTAALTIMTIRYPDSFRGSRYFDEFRFSDLVTNYVAGWASCLLIAMLPIAAMARQSMLFKRNLSTERPRSYLGLPAVLFALLLMLIALAPVVNLHWSRSTRQLTHDAAFISAVVAIYVGCTWFLFRLTYLLKIFPWVVAIFWTLLTWVGPTLAQLLVSSFGNDHQYTPVIGLSPIAALGLRLSRRRSRAVAGADRGKR